jgi:dipeptidyl-peptidase 4
MQNADFLARPLARATRAIESTHCLFERLPTALRWFMGGILFLMVSSWTPLWAQDRLKTMPGYKQYERMKDEIGKSVKLGALSVTWTNDSKAFIYRKDNKSYLFDLATATEKTLPPPPTNRPAAPARDNRENRDRSRRERPARGRQFTNAVAPNGLLRAFYRNHNLWLSDTNGRNEVAVTTEGSAASRVKFGAANWVYGEELYQTTAIWWSSNSQKLAFYRFDESQLKDYYLALGLTKIQSSLLTEPYMKAGDTNPVVDLLVYDLATKKTVRLDVRDGKPFDNSVIGHYVYGVSWTADSNELLFRRTNRRQNIMELCAANPETGRCRVVVREEWPASWTDNSPLLRLLADGRRFVWGSERTGWRNFYLYHLDGRLLATLTRHPFEVEGIERIDEKGGHLYYTARSGDNPMKLQLHRVGLDGRGDRRLTNPAFHHSVNLAPDCQHFIDVLQTHNTPPVTRLLTTDGKTVGEIARSDLTRFNQLGLKTAELLNFKAADGTNELFGLLQFPSTFKPTKRYPLLVSVYAGPATAGARETFVLPSALAELGFLVASFDSRSASGRGKRFLDAIYLKLGTVEIDDQAAGVKALRDRRYVDGRRVGIYGTSYGGFASVMCLLRYPDVFQAACANSAVTDFRHYDSIYTERYMWIPQENKAGYDGTSTVRLAKELAGRLMIFYGTADDNVHPSNAMQLIEALQKANKSFEVQIGPDLGHTAVNRERMMEFFIENLVMR